MLLHAVIFGNDWLLMTERIFADAPPLSDKMLMLLRWSMHSARIGDLGAEERSAELMTSFDGVLLDDPNQPSSNCRTRERE